MGALVQNWWMMAVRGLLAMLFGIAILAWPHAPLLTVVVVFGFYVVFGGCAILDGLWAIAAVVRASPRGPTREVWPLAAEGGASLGLGILALVWPFVSYKTILIIAGWGLITGVLEFALASRAPDRASRWLLATAGAFSCFLAGVVLILPHADAGLVASLLGAYALAFGAVVTMAALAFRRRHTAVRARAASRSSSLRSGASAASPAGEGRSHRGAGAPRDQ
jgi:uncharacterized membrane protein HdeD (DUF308 family)